MGLDLGLDGGFVMGLDRGLGRGLDRGLGRGLGKGGGGPSHVASGPVMNPASATTECWKCGGTGHWAFQCPTKKIAKPE